MDLQLGTGQEVSIHEVESIETTKVEGLYSTGAKDTYFRTMHVKTKSGENVEITLFSKDKDVLEYKD